MKPNIVHNKLGQVDEHYRLLIEAVTDYAIYLLDPDGYITSWNPGAQRFKGYEAKEIIGQHFSRFYTEEDRANGLPATALKVSAREGTFENEGWRVRKDGSKFWASVVIDSIYNPNGEILGFAKITRDISEKKENERLLLETREALFQSQKMEAIGQLTGGIAHDFNNLLMAILGSLEVGLRRGIEDQKLKSLIENAIQGAQRGVTLTQRMLAFARRQELSLSNIDLQKLITGILELLRRSLGATVNIEVEFEKNLKYVKADANQVELAILNLAMNARDAMPNGGKIRIVAENMLQSFQGGFESPRSDFVRISVIDNGEGMDEATLARAMEPFFTTKGMGKGTGLGLAMVHGAAEQTGGKLVLRSKKHEGTTAELWIPAAETDAETTQPVVTEIAKSQPLRILAVDDDPLVLMNTVAMLEELGHEVFRAFSAKEALKIYRSVNIDLVLTDQIMPQITGVELVEFLRAITPDVRVILTSGYMEFDPDTALGLPRLSKPFTQNDLARALLGIGKTV